MTAVLIVEDPALLAESRSVALRAEGFSAVIAPLFSPTELLNFARVTAPDVVLLDLELPIGSGLDLIAPLVDCGAAVIVVSGTRSRLDIAATLEAGAHGFLAKNRPLE